MKIVILSTVENYQWAGTEEVWWQFANYALSKRHEIFLYCSESIAENKKIEQLMGKGLEVVVRKSSRFPWPKLIKKRLNRDYKKIAKFYPDILLVNSGSLVDILNLPYVNILCNKVKCSKVLYSHFVSDDLQPENRLALREFLLQMDSIVFVSNQNKDLAERQIAAKIENAEVILNESKFLLTKPLPFNNSSRVNFASVAKFETKWKAQDVLLETLGSEYWLSLDWHLNMYGEGPDEEYIKELITFYNLAERVSLRGFVDNVAEIWEHNHLLLLPSRAEGTPLALLEAMMCGRPVVTTKVGGNPEVLADEELGWMAEYATAPLFDTALRKAWNSRDQWKSMGERAHARVVELSRENPIRKLEKVLQKNMYPIKVRPSR